MVIRARRHGMGRHRGVARWRLGLLAVLPALVAGCLSFEEPTPSPAPRTPEPSPTASAPPRTADTLVVAVPGDPAGWLPPASDAASAFLVNVLYDPLYRLDPTLTPQPELAAGPPLVSGGGLSWSITLAGGDLRFADGTPLRASDVVFSLRLARSPACPLGRDLCDSVSRYLDELGEPSAERLTLTLREPHQPFLAEVLGRLPILSEVSVRAGAAAIIAAASGLNPRAPDAQVARIAEATNAEACLSEVPPFGCRLADHIADLESTLGSAGLAPPARAIWTDATGTFDEEAYAGALLDRVAALGQVLSGREIDQLAAALTLIDPVARPLGSGPFRLERVAPGEGLSLVANPYHVGGAPGIARIEVRIVRDPAAAATLLQTGDVDWLPSIAPDQVVGLDAAAGLHAAMRPLPLQRTIVFNTRPGRVYADAPTRQAFARCLDRDALVAQAGSGSAAPAHTWSASGSWAFPDAAPAPADVAEAGRLLDAAGWIEGTDGIRVRDGQRLSSEIAIRPSRADLLSFAQAASAALADCGIELLVRDLDLTGDLLLRQLQWPNDFDTVLISRALGVDPDHDMEAYAGAHVTSEDNPADANPGGYTSAAADALIADARVAPTRAGRAALYAQLDALLDADQPAWTLWFDTAGAAVSDRVRVGLEPLDPSVPRYDWDPASWTLRPVS